MTNERVEQIIEEAKEKHGYKYYLSNETCKELQDAGVSLYFVDNGVRWKGTKEE